jgi:hypothetical protein
VSTFAPGVRERWTALFQAKASAELATAVLGYRPAIRLLELDAAGTIDLDHEPALQAFLLAWMSTAERTDQ